jgi:hypothetical protein
MFWIAEREKAAYPGVSKVHPRADAAQEYATMIDAVARWESKHEAPT